MSRPKDFANADFVEGDVIGLEICLPSLSLHRKVAEGTYNKAVDVSDDLDPVAAHEYLDIIRDRVPIRFKNTLYFGMCISHVSPILTHGPFLPKDSLLEHIQKLEFGQGSDADLDIF